MEHLPDETYVFTQEDLDRFNDFIESGKLNNLVEEQLNKDKNIIIVSTIRAMVNGEQ